MEKSLVEKLLNGTCDEIDRDMITARIADFHDKFMTLCDDFCTKLQELVSDHKVEMGLSGHAIVMGVFSDVENKMPIQMIVGRPNLCEKVHDEMGKSLKEKKKELNNK